VVGRLKAAEANGIKQGVEEVREGASVVKRACELSDGDRILEIKVEAIKVINNADKMLDSGKAYPDDVDKMRGIVSALLIDVERARIDEAERNRKIDRYNGVKFELGSIKKSAQNIKNLCKLLQNQQRSTSPYNAELPVIDIEKLRTKSYDVPRNEEEVQSELGKLRNNMAGLSTDEPLDKSTMFNDVKANIKSLESELQTLSNEDLKQKILSELGILKSQLSNSQQDNDFNRSMLLDVKESLEALRKCLPPNLPNKTIEDSLISPQVKASKPTFIRNVIDSNTNDFSLINSQPIAESPILSSILPKETKSQQLPKLGDKSPFVINLNSPQQPRQPFQPVEPTVPTVVPYSTLADLRRRREIPSIPYLFSPDGSNV
jgi:hypothetical protein